MRYVFVELDTNVPTWRTAWPAKELRRRGYETLVWASDGAPKFDPIAGEATFIVHFVNKAWTLPDGDLFTHVNVFQRLREYGPVYMNYDDDWSRMLDVQARPVPTVARVVHSEIPELTRMATKVIVSTPRLAEVFGRWNEVEVVHNYLPEWVFDLPPLPKIDRIGWMGEMYLHGMDWNMLMPFAKDLPPLYLIGTSDMSAERVRSWGADVENTGVVLDQRKLYQEVGRPVGAVIPLDDTPFNRGKSWTKPMEFMARGVHPVASPHAEYTALNDLTGALPTAETPEALVEAANQLWESKGEDGCDLPGTLRHAGLTMEQAGGDEWEKALA